MNNIKLVDCTLRDGGHLCNSVFGKAVIDTTVCGLINSGVDIIELGFLSAEPFNEDASLYGSIADVKKILPADLKNTKIALMAYRFDASSLEAYDGTVEWIRSTFHAYDFAEGIENCKAIKSKGYKCSANLINFIGAYTDTEKIEALKKINEIHPDAISIADTYGLMDLRDMEYLYHLVERILDKDITIGIHMHENKGISYALAQRFLEIKEPKRNAIIDAAIFGMGEVPGNVRLELIMDYMNKYYGTMYDVRSIYHVIDQCIGSLKKQVNWDYDLPYAISAKYGINRKYAKFLIEKEDMNLCGMDVLMANISGEDMASYNKKTISKLYEDFRKETDLNDEYI